MSPASAPLRQLFTSRATPVSLSRNGNCVCRPGGAPPLVRSRREVEPLRELRITLRDHYRDKRALYGEPDSAMFDRDLKKLFPPEDWGKRHLQIIYFGREHCPARRHDPKACPICSWAA